MSNSSWFKSLSASLMPLLFLCLLPSESRALIYRAVFPDLKVIYFAADDKKGHKQLRLDPAWFKNTMGVELSEVSDAADIDDRDELLTISGGVKLGDDRPELTLAYNAQYALEFARAVDSSYFGTDARELQDFNPATEKRIHVKIDTDNGAELPDIMRRVVRLADSLVQDRSIIRWRPHFRTLRQINQVYLSVELPHDSSMIGVDYIGDPLFSVTQAFLNEFSTNRVSFASWSLPQDFMMNREGKFSRATSSRLTNRIKTTLVQNNLNNVVYNPFYPRTNWLFSEQFVINLTIEDSGSGLTCLRDTLAALKNYLHKNKSAFMLQLIRVEEGRDVAAPSATPVDGAITMNQARVVMGLTHFVPDPIILYPTYALRHSLGSNKLLKVMKGGRDSRVQINRWNNIHLSKTVLTDSLKRGFMATLHRKMHRKKPKAEKSIPLNVLTKQAASSIKAPEPSTSDSAI